MVWNPFTKVSEALTNPRPRPKTRKPDVADLYRGPAGGEAAEARFSFVRQVVGYYYYVEVWRHVGMDVVFEEADLARLEATKREDPGLVHELVFHPDGTLASTWQPWDGVLGPGVPA